MIKVIIITVKHQCRHLVFGNLVYFLSLMECRQVCIYIGKQYSANFIMLLQHRNSTTTGYKAKIHLKVPERN